MSDYYERNAHEYQALTFAVDPTEFLLPLHRRLKPGDKILDVGCGAGRDMLWFHQRGFQVIGFERSATLAALARRNTGCDIILGDFEAFDFSCLHFDAMLLVGALAHVHPRRAGACLENIAAGLRPGGKLLLSVKAGEGVRHYPDGRRHYLWSDQDLRVLLASVNFTVLGFQQQMSAVRDTDLWFAYVLEKGRHLDNLP